MRKVKIVSQDGRTHLFVDGEDVSKGCLAFCLQQDGGEFPKLTVTMCCDKIEVNTEAEVKKTAAPAATGTAYPLWYELEGK